MKSRFSWSIALIAVACDPGSSGEGTGADTDDGSTGGAPTSGADDGDTTSGADDGGTTGDADTGPPGTSSGEEGTDTGLVCEDVGALDPRRSLIETRQDVLEGFTLAEVLAAVASNAGLDPAPQDTHDRLFDTYRVAAMGEFAGHHCDDEQVDGVSVLNGYPLICPRSEGAFAAFDGALDGWMLTAIVNRLDLAPEDGSHCGEQRMIFANPNMVGRAFVILEAQIPNPSPSCGIAACGPVAELWVEQHGLDDPAQRAERLRAAFVEGDPDLQAAGFGPFMSADNLTFGTGQVRTNNFVTGPWTLREYKLVPQDVGSATRLRPEPVPVAASMHDTLWNDLAAHPAGSTCRDAILDALPGLLVDDVATMGWVIPPACRSSESVEFQDFYEEQLLQGTGSFAAALQARIQALDPGSPLTPGDVARRAQFAGSCIGCHEHSTDVPLGGGLVAPASLGFVHVEEQVLEPCDGGASCFAVSPALAQDFLPRRMEALLQVREAACEQGCEAASSSGPAPGARLPPAGLDARALRALDQAAQPRGLTLSGRPAGAGH
ncbi:MAG: hypothetical protein KDK70_06025 [Myxococcales bacterium]|nr:hypothetical protein [Myxococcales bacterium]